MIRLLVLQNLTKVGKIVAGQICWRKGGDLRDIYVIMVGGNRRGTSC